LSSGDIISVRGAVAAIVFIVQRAPLKRACIQTVGWMIASGDHFYRLTPERISRKVRR
jgi:hypothetical protein